MRGEIEEGESEGVAGEGEKRQGERGIWEQAYNIGSGPTSAALHLNIFYSCQQLVK